MTNMTMKMFSINLKWSCLSDEQYSNTKESDSTDEGFVGAFISLFEL